MSSLSQIFFKHHVSISKQHITQKKKKTRTEYIFLLGCTPLHWATLRGILEACVVLQHSGTKQELMVKDSAGFTPAQIAADRGHHHVSLILSNAHRAQNSCWKDKSWIKKIRDIFSALILLSLVFVSTLIFINSVLFASNLVKVTTVVGLWGWTTVTLSIAYLLMVIRCSSKDSGYVNMSGGIKNNADAEGPFLTIDLTNTAYWSANWSQLCPTCKWWWLAGEYRSGGVAVIRPICSKHCLACKHVWNSLTIIAPGSQIVLERKYILLQLLFFVQKNKWDFFVFLFLGTLTIARRKRCLICLLMRLDKKNVLERVIFVSEKLVIGVGYDCNPMVFATDRIRSYRVGR
uniref:PGG domain-containing protein n=1 Tax=Lactuca sativa TaxID=4236 RepID=A0A9R1UJJ1_LACSA|nr:hypothetical protein LSAT_V11C900504490 [Lactuca sativa]